MQRQTLARGLRVTLGARELELLIDLARAGAGSSPDLRAVDSLAGDLLAELEAGLEDLRGRRAAASAGKRRAATIERDRAAREFHATLGDWHLSATLGDWLDLSPDPDFSHWGALEPAAIEARPQAEIRRNAWRFFLTRGHAAGDDFEIFSGVTATDSRAEILPAAELALDRRRARRQELEPAHHEIMIA